MNLCYDDAGLLASSIGNRGLSEDKIDGLTPRLTAARDALKAFWDDGTLGFFDCPDASTETLTKWAKTKRIGYTDQVVIGIGGSSLGARAVLESHPTALGGLRTHFTENIDPMSFLALMSEIDLENTLFIVITKSGSTIETMSKFWIAYERICNQFGDGQATSQFVAVTDSNHGGLRKFADEVGFETFDVPANVGGRFSVLSNVGLVPLALAGYPVERLLAGARFARNAAFEESITESALVRSAAQHYLLGEMGYAQTVMMPYSDQLAGLAEWFCQLWGESLGKSHTREGELVNVGLTPIRALGVVDQHSQVQLYAAGPYDKHIVFVEAANFDLDMPVPSRPGLPDSLTHLQGKTLSEILDAELVGTRAALTQAGRPISRWVMNTVNSENVGAFLFAWEFITAMVGELYNINAFDQPGVELGKRIAHGILGRPGFEEDAEIAGGLSENLRRVL